MSAIKMAVLASALTVGTVLAQGAGPQGAPGGHRPAGDHPLERRPAGR